MRKWLPKLSGINTRYLYVTLDQTVLSGASFVLNLLLIRYLSIEVFGVYVIVFSFLMLAGSIHSALVTSPIGVIVSKLDDGAAVQYVGQLNFGVLFLWISFSLLFAIAAFIFSLMGGYEEYRVPLYCISLVLCFYLGQQYIRSILLSRLKLLDVLINDVIYTLFQLATVLVLIFFDRLSVTSMILTVGFSALISLFYGIYQCRDFVQPFRKNSWSAIKSNLEHGRWLLGTTIVAWGRTNMLNFVALYFMGPIAPGILRAIQTVYGPINMLLVGLESILPQFCSKIYVAQGDLGLSASLQKVSRLLLMGVVSYAVLVSFFSEILLSILFGEKYVEYSFFVFVLGVQYLLIVWQTVNMIYLRVMNHPKYIFWAFIVEFVVTVVPGIWLSKAYALEGVMAWKLLTAVVVALLTYSACQRIRRKYR